MDDYRKIAGAFLIGGVIGAAVALLYAPQSGRDTRRNISKTARRVRRETADMIEDTIDGIHDFSDDVKDRVSEILDQGKDLSESAKKSLLRNLEQGQNVIEKQRKKIAEALRM